VPTPDRLRPAPFIAGFAGGAIVTLIGIWLAVAPFAVGYQPDGADWVDATIIGVATGVALIVLGLVTIVVLAVGLRDEARRRGLAPTTSAAAGELEPEPVDPGDHDPSEPADLETVDLETVLAPLAAALLEDLRNGHVDHTGPTHPAASPADDRPA
jgi:hypothetical protein